MAAINTRIDSSYESLNSSFVEVAQYVDSSIKTMSAHIEQYDAVHAAAFNDLDIRVTANRNAITEIDSSIDTINSSINAINSSIDYIDSSISEMDEVRAAAIVDLARRVAALEAASTTASVLAEETEQTEQTEQ